MGERWVSTLMPTSQVSHKLLFGGAPVSVDPSCTNAPTIQGFTEVGVVLDWLIATFYLGLRAHPYILGQLQHNLDKGLSLHLILSATPSI